jgi:hypothetical protein
MEGGIPVGVLMQTKPKRGVEYDVLGLARGHLTVTEAPERWVDYRANPDSRTDDDEDADMQRLTVN